MRIVIESEESGWAVTRTAELPEDEKLVKALLRTVRKHGVEKERRKETDAPQTQEAEVTCEESERSVIQPADEEAQSGGERDGAFGNEEPERTTFEGPAYWGFLIVKCEHCGDVRAFCSKAPIRKCICKKCGHETPLEDMVTAELKCPSCGRKWVYQTNCVDAGVSAGCIECGTEMTGWWDKKKKKYRSV